MSLDPAIVIVIAIVKPRLGRAPLHLPNQRQRQRQRQTSQGPTFRL